MRIVVNFRNPGEGSITQWNMVSFSYIVVSRNFAGTFSNIWAHVAEYVNPADSNNAAFDTVGLLYLQDPAGALATGSTCSIYTDPFYSVGSGCAAGTAITAGSTAGGKKLVHTYIMGFMWNPAKTTAHYLAGGVIPRTTGGTSLNENLVAVTLSQTATAAKGP
jgi:hypothetical protein